MRGVWRKSTYSGALDNDCVEIAPISGRVRIRDSKRPGVVVTLSSLAWTGLLVVAKADKHSAP